MNKSYTQQQFFSNTSTIIHFNHCLCGWWFPSFSKHYTKCPQCRDEQRLCLNCGEVITGHHHKKVCDDCGKMNKKVLNKYQMRLSREKEKYTFSDRNNDDRICNYNCNDCKFSECLLPVDKDDFYDGETLKMFEGE